MYHSFFEKEQAIKKLFSACDTKESRYDKIIELGKEANKMQPENCVESDLVQGCQSTMYLHSWLENGKVFFKASSDALISAGLAELLIKAYSGEPPEVVIKALPTFIDDLELAESLSASRANGFYQIHLRMKQDALKWLISTQ